MNYEKNRTKRMVQIAREARKISKRENWISLWAWEMRFHWDWLVLIIVVGFILGSAWGG